MSEIDKMARGLLATELERRGLRSVAAAVVNGSYDSEPDHAAIRAALLTAPPGWRLVPVEPTPHMSAAGFCADEGHDPAGVYRAMIAAAPEPKA